MTSTEQNEPEGTPVSEFIYIILNLIGIYGLFSAISAINSGVGGFGDLVIVLGSLFQVLTVLISLPFLVKSLNREIKFDLFTKFGIIIPIIILVEITILLIQFDANLAFTGVMIAPNIIPPIIFLTKNN